MSKAIRFLMVSVLAAISTACMTKKDPAFQNSNNISHGQLLIMTAEKQEETGYTPEVHQAMMSIWEDPNSKDVFYHDRYKYHIFDNAEHFLQMLSKLTSDYIPSSEDILKSRIKTIGVNDLFFKYKHQDQTLKFALTDVGGQRGERKKWQKIKDFFSSNIIFVSSLSEYDQTCYEDDVTNRMLENIELFGDTVNNGKISTPLVILVFNKLDLFKQKLKTSPLKATFPDYDGGEDEQKAISYIKDRYVAVNKGDPNRIRVVYTVATEKDSVKQTFDEIFKICLETKL